MFSIEIIYCPYVNSSKPSPEDAFKHQTEFAPSAFIFFGVCFLPATFCPSITYGKWNKFPCPTICMGSDGFYRGRDINRSGFPEPLNRVQVQSQLNKTYLTTFFSARNQMHKWLCDVSHQGADKSYNQQCNNASSTFYMGLETVY